MLEIIIAVILGLIAMDIGAGVIVWMVKACDPCKHSYERVDNANDKNAILVCRRCGKIKKIRK